MPARRVLAAAVLTVCTARGFAEPPVPAEPVVSAAPSPSAAPMAEVSFLPQPADQEKPRLDAAWDNGVVVSSADKQFRFHAGGIGQIDSVWLIGPKANFVAPNGSTSGVGNAAATQLRRAILQVDGTVYSQFDFIIQYDFANASNDNDSLQPPSFGN